MDQKKAPLWLRPFLRARMPLLAILVSLATALVLLLVLRNFSYRQFPRTIDALKGDKTTIVSDLEREFSVAPGTERNSWNLEIEFFKRPDAEAVFRISVNGMPVQTIRAPGKRLVLEFSSPSLREGHNVLKISSATAWSFRRLRVKNISGYSSGFLSAVIF